MPVDKKIPKPLTLLGLASGLLLNAANLSDINLDVEGVRWSQLALNWFHMSTCTSEFFALIGFDFSLVTLHLTLKYVHSFSAS